MAPIHPPTHSLLTHRADFMNHAPPGSGLTLRVDPVPHMDKSYAARHLVKGSELYENYNDYAPIPAFRDQCFSKDLPSPAERCASVRAKLRGAGLWWEHCRRHKFFNASFGRQYAPYVDKHRVKQLVSALNVSGLTTPATLAFLRRGESRRAIAAAVDALMAHELSIVKFTHWSGGVVQAGRKGIKKLKGKKLRKRMLKKVNMTECGYSLDDKPRHCAAALINSIAASTVMGKRYGV